MVEATMNGSTLNGDSGGDRLIGEYKESKLLKRAAEVVADKVKACTVFDGDAENRIPRFDLEELNLGRVLGRGGFCVVNEVKKITLDGTSQAGGDNSANGADQHDEEYVSNIVQDRKFMESYCIRKGNQARYAVKMLSESTMKDAHTFINGIVDLAIEARFLAVIRHPNIIKMRAVRMGEVFHRDYFLVLDRLYDTLTQRLASWKKRNVTGFKKLIDVKGKKKTAFWLERITVAYDLSSALKYLHGLNIVYRDLKPDNIGFDVRGDVKIFDFGLAKELPSDSALKVGDLYKLTGDTGSLRYMAPECALEKPYNESVDVYSFGILLYQMCSLETPFEGYTVNMFNKKVVRGGARPKTDPKWPTRITSNMSRAWGIDIPNRPTMEDMSRTLRDEINDLADDEVNELLDISRKSEISMHSK